MSTNNYKKSILDEWTLYKLDKEIVWPPNRLSKIVMARDIIRAKGKKPMQINSLEINLEPSFDDYFWMLILLNKIYIIIFISLIIFITVKLLFGYHKYIHG